VIVYFAGVNQTHLCEMFKGLHVLESFVSMPRLLERFRPTFASVALDCGAFTAMNLGVTIDLAEYGDFVEQHGAAYDFCASLDSIDGGVAVNVSNYEALRKRGLKVTPTWHQGEPVSLLDDYCRDSDRVGLGFQRPIQDPEAFIDSAFDRIPSHIKAHGWAMTSYTDWPFHSVDSSTWLFEVKALLGVSGQGSEAIRCLTMGELIGIVQKKYERLPKRHRWSGRDQSNLFERGPA